MRVCVVCGGGGEGKGGGDEGVAVAGPGLCVMGHALRLNPAVRPQPPAPPPAHTPTHRMYACSTLNPALTLCIPHANATLHAARPSPSNPNPPSTSCTCTCRSPAPHYPEKHTHPPTHPPPPQTRTCRFSEARKSRVTPRCCVRRARRLALAFSSSESSSSSEAAEVCVQERGRRGGDGGRAGEESDVQCGGGMELVGGRRASETGCADPRWRVWVGIEGRAAHTVANRLSRAQGAKPQVQEHGVPCQ